MKIWLLVLSFFANVCGNALEFPLDAQYVVENSWQGGYKVVVTLTNQSGSTAASWKATFTLPPNQKLITTWSGIFSVSGQNVTVTSPSWSTLKPGGSRTFGMTIKNTPTDPKAIYNLMATGFGTAPPVPGAPVLNPISGDPAVPNNYTVTWNSVSGSSSYTLQQDTNSSFSNPQVVLQGNVLSYVAMNQPNGTYYYRVSATNSTGTGPYSKTQSIAVPVILQAPFLQAIANPFGSGNYSVNWSAVPYAQQYALQEATAPDFSNLQTLFMGLGTTFQVSGRVPNTYYYRVFAFDGALMSNPSNVQKAVVGPTAVAIVEGYWESWTSTSSSAINAIVNMKVDVINISFAKFTKTGTHTFSISGIECSQTALTSFITAAHQAGRKVKLSIGGATYPLGGQLLTLQDAMGMAQAVALFVQANALDGVDYDIEDSPAANLQIALLQNTRQLLGNSALISYTAKSPASTTHPYREVILGGYQYVDYISIMAYDYAPGYTYQNDVSTLLSLGIPASKIVVGLLPGYDDLHVMTSLAHITTACQYVLSKGLVGIMFWDLNRDLNNTTGLGASAATNTAWGVFHPN